MNNQILGTKQVNIRIPKPTTIRLGLTSYAVNKFAKYVRIKPPVHSIDTEPCIHAERPIGRIKITLF